MYDELIKRLRHVASYDPRTVVQDCEDAADAIEELQAYANLYEYTSSLGLKLARSVLEAFPKWIPAAERLPEKSGWYLTRCNQWGGFIHRIALCAVQDRTWTEWTDKEYDITEYVTHWMAIPKVPEEAEE